MNRLKTTTAGLLEASAAAAMREGAENTIRTAVSDFEKLVRERVYDEVSKLAIYYAQTMTKGDPLSPALEIVIVDRREGSK